VKVHVACRGEQGQPAADDEQPLMFGEGLLRVEEARDVREVPPYALQQLGWGRPGVGDG
jgi:hypothetical protein